MSNSSDEESVPTRPSAYQLWANANGDRDAYILALKEHGHLVPGKPTDLGCGWPSKRVSAPEADTVEEVQA